MKVCACILSLALAAAAPTGKPITEVYQNADYQLTGVTVAKSGRMFVNFPRWSDRYLNAVIEVLPGGKERPYPDEPWNRWDGKPATAGKAFVCVQSVVADDAGHLWILDPAAPSLGPVVQGGPKLIEVDLQTDRILRVIPFGPDVARSNSYLNDIRIDTHAKTAYMTDSGAGGIVVLDLATGKARRTLDEHPSVKPDPRVDIRINGKPVRDATGKQPMIASDGIALSPQRDYLYYQALTGAALYRIKTSVLRDANARPEAVAAAVERVAKTFPVDGLWIDPQNRLYLSGLNQGAILRRNPDGMIETLASDPRIQWPDTFSQGADGAIYFTTSHIHETPRFNNGKAALSSPYAVFKLTP